MDETREQRATRHRVEFLARHRAPTPESTTAAPTRNQMAIAALLTRASEMADTIAATLEAAAGACEESQNQAIGTMVGMEQEAANLAAILQTALTLHRSQI